MALSSDENYRRYLNDGLRPDDKLPPIDFQDGEVLLVHGEVYCRHREEISGMLCLSNVRRSYQDLKQHYNRYHGLDVTSRVIYDDENAKNEALRWYADVVNWRDPSEPTLPLDMRVTVDELPLGASKKEENHQSAIRLSRLFKKYSKTMPQMVRRELRCQLIGGAFQHNAKSLDSPMDHQIATKMYDRDKKEAKWMNVTYERWFILVGVYGMKRLHDCQCIIKAVLARCGDKLDEDLTYKHGRDDTKAHMGTYLTQLGDAVSNLEDANRHQGEVMSKQGDDIRQLQEDNERCNRDQSGPDH